MTKVINHKMYEGMILYGKDLLMTMIYYEQKVRGNDMTQLIMKIEL